MDLRKAETEVKRIHINYELLRKSKVASEKRNVSLSMIPRLSSFGDENGATVEEEEEESKVVVSANEALSILQSLRNQIMTLKPQLEKIKKRMKEKDPVTEAPRYGEKTMKRAKQVCEQYEEIQSALMGQLLEQGQELLQQELEQQQSDAKREEQMKQEKYQSIQQLQQQKEAMERQQLLEQQQKEQLQQQRQVEELARRAEQARRQRIQAEQEAIESARQAERAFIASIPKGAHGVKIQLDKLKKESSSKEEYSTAVTALHTIFSQIVAHPEEIKFRRIRRDHPKFLEDIGRHTGGKEVLVAAGFKIDTIDEVSCFFSKEPDIEHDMDGWSNWYNLLKETLQILEEAIIHS